MKILLDECLPTDFRHSFREHDVHSAEWAGMKGMKNGTLLAAAEGAGYDAFLTTDRGIPYQQPSGDRTMSVLILCAATNKIEDLQLLVPAIEAALVQMRPGEVRFVS